MWLTGKQRSILNKRPHKYNNTLYRDIKLENIVLDRHGYPKLIDFGMAVTDVRHNTTIFDKSGTKLYQGPEFLIPGMITRRSSDFWSLGVIIHAMLTGKVGIV